MGYTAAMNTMLQKAFTEASSRPDVEQEAIASFVLDELHKRDALRALLLKRREQVAAGQVVDGDEMFARLRAKYFPNTQT